MSFTTYIEEDEIKEKWLKVKKFFFLKESTYDMTSKCNMDCEGCYYFAGDKSFTKDETGPEQWKTLFEAEKERGITFVVLAGAEPTLVPELCKVAYQTIPHGAIATNGILKVPEDIKYRIHISVWGDDDYSLTYRKVKNCLNRQLSAYSEDDRAVFVYTFTKQNIDQIDDIAKRLFENNCKLTFNQFSAPVNYQGELRFDQYARDKMKNKIYQLIDLYKNNILYSGYNIEVHSHSDSLHQQFSCPYPRMNQKNKTMGLGKTFRQYRSDLSRDDSAACCVPDTDCNDCRHYAAGSAIITSKLPRHVDSREMFCKWLDYVDNYLAVWVHGYEKSQDLAKTNKLEVFI